MKFQDICEKVYIKYNKLQEATASSFIKYIKRYLMIYIQNNCSYDELKKNLLSLTRNSDSDFGIVSDIPEIAKINDKITSSGQIDKLIEYACNTLSDEKYIVDKAKKVLERKVNNISIIDELINAINIGNKRAEKKEYDYDGFLQAIKR